MAEQDQNRNEAATPHKLSEARKRGSVPKSQDIGSLVVLCAALLSLHMWGGDIASSELRLMGSILSNADQMSDGFDAMPLTLGGLLWQTLAILAPMMGLIVVMALLGGVFQVGPVFSAFPLKPDFDRINPISGFKRIFSLRLVLEALKTILKCGLLGYVLYFAVRDALPVLVQSIQMQPFSIGKILGAQAKGLLLKLLAVLVLLALFDLVYSRWDYFRRLKMSRREIKDELKRREGDPRIKARIRELQREAVKRSKSLARVKEADVLIANPVHLAVAVKYDRERIDAPLVIAKGAGLLALRMRAAARRGGVPVVENKKLARALFRGAQIDGAAPPELYGTLAKILVWAYSLKRTNALQGAG